MRRNARPKAFAASPISSTARRALVYRVRLEADRDEAPVLLANGNLEASGDLGDNSITRSGAIRSRSLLLFAIVAGDLAKVSDEFTTMHGRRVELGIYVEPGRETRVAMRWTR